MSSNVSLSVLQFRRFISKSPIKIFFSMERLGFLCQDADEVTFANKCNDAWDFHYLELTMIYCFTINLNITLTARACSQEVKHTFSKSSCFPFHYVLSNHPFNHCHCKLVHYIVWLHPCFQFFFHRWFPNVLVVIIAHYYIWCDFEFIFPQNLDRSVNVKT